MENTDMFSLLEEMGYTLDEVKLSDVIEFASGLGIQNVIFVDLSCSVTDADDRTTRKLRRRLGW
jgi:hypothetical protein